MHSMRTPKNVRTLALTVAVVAASLLIGPLLASFTSPQIADTTGETPTRERNTAARSTTRTPSIARDAGVTETVMPTTTVQPTSSRSPTATATPMPTTTPTELPATATNAPATATSPPSEQVYVVTPGDNLITISQQFGVSIDAIRRRNQLTSDILRVGQELIIPGSSADDGTAVSEDGEQVYVVQSGDVLMAIAERFGVTVEAIRERNGLTGNALQVGQELIIPVPPTPETS